jgi:hypothetical protein
MRNFRDLEAVAAGAIVCALVAEFVPLTPIRAVAALLLALVLPGYAITAAAFAKARLGGPQQLVLTAGTSLACLPLAALLLNIIPGGLTTRSWSIALLVVVLVACYVAAFRRPAATRPRRWTFRLRVRDAVLLVLAALIFAGAIVLAQTPLPAKDADGFAALWILPSRADQDGVEVGVLSNRQHAAEYRLQVSEEGGPTTEMSLKLDPGEERTVVVPVARRSGSRSHVTATLYRAGLPGTVYRRVNIWLPRRGTFP